PPRRASRADPPRKGEGSSRVCGALNASPQQCPIRPCAGGDMETLLLKNFRLLEPEVGELQGGFELLIEGDKVKDLSDKPIKTGSSYLDCGGRTLMPGLIDSHVHVTLSEVNIRFLEAIPLTLMAARAARLMLGMINRGFTSVRDTGGADW